MGAITVTAASVGLVHPTRAETWPVKLAATVTAGQLLYVNTSGSCGLVDTDNTATDVPFVVALEGGVAGQVVSGLRKGAISGATLTSLDYGALVYASGTAGGLSTTPKVQCVGKVVPLSDPGLTKVLFVDIPWGHADYS